MSIILNTIFTSLLLLLTLPAFAAGSALPAARQTELIYFLKQDCGSCHGMTLKGGLGTPLLPKNLVGKSTNYLVDRILNGVPGTAMPPWKAFLKPAEAKFLVETMKKGVSND